MAADHGEHTGSTDMTEHLRTWKLFTAFFKWQIAGVAVVMLLLLIFRTG